MLKWLRVLLLCTFLVGCATKLVYHNLDWFVIDYAEDFVDLNTQQKTLIETNDAEFTELASCPRIARLFGNDG